MNLKQKLSFGFGLIILLLLITSTLSYTRFSDTNEGFNEYRSLALINVGSGRVQANILEARLAANKYIKKQSQDSIDALETRLQKSITLIDELLALPLNAADKAKFTTMRGNLVDYGDAFHQVVKLIDTRNELVKANLDPNGLAMRKNVTDLMQSAYSNNDLAAAVYSGSLQESILLARLYAAKYLVSNEPSDAERAKQEFVAVQQRANTLKDELSSSTQRRLYANFDEAFQTYRNTFDEVVNTIQERNGIIRGKLDVIGAQVAESIERTKLSVKAQQDSLGPEMVDRLDGTKNLILYLSALAILLAVVIAYMIYNGILRVVGGEPAEIADIVQRISKGDLSKSVEKTGQESGIYANIVEMQIELRTIIEGFHQISERIGESSLSLERNMVAADDNAQRELSQVEQISTAITQLSSTASEVSSSATGAERAASKATENVELGKSALSSSDNISTKIASSVQETSEIVEQLNKFSIEIGSVVEVINSISEQTNLLALNAAIEAARAGEQGRGFAVVADEVRSLAAKTQESTISIQDIISKLQSQATQANEFMQQNTLLVQDSREINEKLSSSFNEIAISVTDISDINTQVATASEEQSSVTHNVSESVATTFDIVNENVSGIQEGKQASVDMSRLADEQKRLLEFFKL